MCPVMFISLNCELPNNVIIIGLNFLAVHVEAAVPPITEWERACRVFQKRHLLAHKMGVIDEEYVQKANDAGAVVGRKIHVDKDEVTSAIGIIEALGRRLFAGVHHPAS